MLPVLALVLTSHLQREVVALLPHQHHWPPPARFPRAIVLQGEYKSAVPASTEGTRWLNSSGMLSLSNEMTGHFILHKALAYWERKINLWLAGGVVPWQHFPSFLSIVDLISLKKRNQNKTKNPKPSTFCMVCALLISCGAGGTGLGCLFYQKCPCLLEELPF